MIETIPVKIKKFIEYYPDPVKSLPMEPAINILWKKLLTMWEKMGRSGVKWE
jgi:hypothetical protein